MSPDEYLAIKSSQETPDTVAEVSQKYPYGSLPSEKEEESLENLALGGAIGAGVGGVLGAVTPPQIKIPAAVGSRFLSSLVGAVEGGFTGLGSSLAGKVALDSFGDNPTGHAVALGAELAVGATPTIAHSISSAVNKYGIIGSLTAMGVPYNKAKALQAIPGFGETETALRAKSKLFGSKVMSGGVRTEKYTDSELGLQQKMLKQLYNVEPIVGMSPSKQLERKLVDTLALNMSKERQLATQEAKLNKDISSDYFKMFGQKDESKAVYGFSPDPNRPVYGILNSPEFQSAIDGIRKVADAGGIEMKSRDADIIENFLKRENWEKLNPKDFYKKFQALTSENTIIPLENQLSSRSQQVLVDAMDSWLVNRGERPMYGELKKMRENYYVARARDNLRPAIQQAFDGKYGEDLLNNIKKSPQGREELKIAVASLLRGLPEKDALNKWNQSILPLMEKTGAMSTEEIRALNRAVGLYSGKSTTKKVGEVASTSVKKALIMGIAPSELAQQLSYDNVFGL